MAAPDLTQVERQGYLDILGIPDDPELTLADLRAMTGGGAQVDKAVRAQSFSAATQQQLDNSVAAAADYATQAGDAAEATISGPVGDTAIASHITNPASATAAALTSKADTATVNANRARADRREGTLLGECVFDPSTANVVNVSSTTPAIPTDGRANLVIDFFAPESGEVDVSWDMYVGTVTGTSNEYVGAALMVGDVVWPGSEKLVARRGAATGQTVEGRFVYTHRITGLTPGASYSVMLGLFSAAGLQVSLWSGGAYGPTRGTARAAMTRPNPLGVTLTADVPTTILSDATVNSFPGLCVAPNAFLVAAYRKATSLTGGGNGLRVLRSGDGGATWGGALTVANDPTLDYGTAALYTIPSTLQIALSTWTRPNAGGTPNRDIRVYFSDDNGLSFPSYKSVDTGSWLTRYAVTESPLCEFAGAWLLGVWGEDTVDAATSYQAGIMRSTDGGDSWTRVALFKDFPARKFNEVGVAAHNGVAYAVIRDEVLHGFWLSTSTDGITWTDPVVIRGEATCAPRLTFIDGIGYFVVRNGPDSTGRGMLLGLNPETGECWRASHLRLVGAVAYGQCIDLGTSIGCLSSDGISAGDYRLMWSTFTVS